MAAAAPRITPFYEPTTNKNTCKYVNGVNNFPEFSLPIGFSESKTVYLTVRMIVLQSMINYFYLIFCIWKHTGRRSTSHIPTEEVTI